jgi:methionyl-tRNA synthetase
LDALTNYISALNYPDTKNKKYKNFWPADVHMIGKDILRFHAVYWPAFLLAADLPPPKRVYGHGWILSGEEKMSKSKGNILDPLEIVEKYGLDPLRYYLLKEVSFGNDGSISQDKLENCINSDLANNYGNLCQRVISFNEKNCNLLIPEKNKFEKEDLLILNKVGDSGKLLRSHMDRQELNLYTNFIVDCLFDANKYFNDQEPWKKKSDIKRLNTIVYVSLEIIRKISILLNPIIPETSLKVLEIFNLKQNDLKFDSIKYHESLKSNDKIKKIDILFKKIEKND